MLLIDQRQKGDTLILRFSGDLDHHAAQRAIEQAEDLLVLYPCRALVLDLSRLTFMDSSGLAVAMQLFRIAARGEREFTVRGAPPQAMRVFEAAGLPQIMIFERGESHA